MLSCRCTNCKVLPRIHPRRTPLSESTVLFYSLRLDPPQNLYGLIWEWLSIPHFGMGNSIEVINNIKYSPLWGGKRLRTSAEEKTKKTPAPFPLVFLSYTPSPELLPQYMFCPNVNEDPLIFFYPCSIIKKLMGHPTWSLIPVSEVYIASSLL